MSEPKEYYRIINKEGNSTAFHIVDFKFIPESNFELALKWYNEKDLIGTSVKEMEVLLTNILIKKKNRRLLDNPGKVTFLDYRNIKIFAPG
jgi:hypothetical protein